MNRIRYLPVFLKKEKQLLDFKTQRGNDLHLEIAENIQEKDDDEIKVCPWAYNEYNKEFWFGVLWNIHIDRKTLSNRTFNKYSYDLLKWSEKLYAKGCSIKEATVIILRTYRRYLR